MADFKRLCAKEAAERILALPETVTVIMHKRPDGDAVSSASALAYILNALGKSAYVISEDPIPERLLFIKEELLITEATELLGEAYVSIDVASPPQLGAFSEHAGKISLMIDHHAVGEAFADGYIDPGASSAAEALLDIAEELVKMDKLKMTRKLAYALFAGISSDTGCFSYSNATAKTHRRAADLMEYGFDAADINHKLHNTKTKTQIKAESFVAGKMETEADGAISIAAISREERLREGLTLEDLDCAVDVIRTLRGAVVSILVKETEDGKMKASLRSVGADVASVARIFGGGGHIRAAGCTVAASSAAEAAKMLAEQVKKII